MLQTTLKTIPFSEALHLQEAGAAFVDLRDVQSYLDVHVPRSLALLYESGPGMAGRARDCLPLELPLMLLDVGDVDLAHAAATLRGKGFNVLGRVEDPINEWAARRGTPASTDVVTGKEPPPGLVLDVGDPGVVGHRFDKALALERLWLRLDEVADEQRVVIAAGYGVRAALAVGMLENAGVPEIFLWKTRD